MNIKFVTKKFNLTEEKKEQIIRHFTKFEKVLKAPYNVVCAVESKPNNQIKLELTVNERKLYRVETYSDTVENAVDEVENRMYRILRKAKEKRDEIKNKPVKQHEEKSVTSTSENVTKVKRFPIKPCTVDEAIEAMLNTDHDFYVFRNDATDSNDVVYVRKDGSIGLIQLI